MKGYTDIEQSKRLAEFLQGADMSYDWLVIGEKYSSIPQCRKFIDDELPCWSLTALLNVIPIEHNLHGYLTENGMAYRVETLYSGNSKSYDNPVDACYEMIIKLHEQKLL